jgi:glycosyltransferase involved in cell wall biosynthesis
MPNPYQNIAVVTTSYPSHERDWAGHFVRQEVLELVRSGGRVTVLTARLAFSKDDGVETRQLARMGRFPRAFALGSFLARACSALRRERFDRVIVHWALPVALAVDDVELVSHGSDARILATLPGRDAIAVALVARARSWRFVSDGLRDELLRSLSPYAARRLLARSFVRAASIDVPDVGARAAIIRAELGAFDVSVGRLVPSKRVDKAIERAARTRDLLVVVGDGPERARLERRAAERAARVRFVGDLPRDEALAYISAARSLLFASEREGCSTVVREARALATPVHVL